MIINAGVVLERGMAASPPGTGSGLAVAGLAVHYAIGIFAEMLRMYMIGGKLFTVPEIKDSNIKENRDIRSFYGAPRQQTSADAG